jgi:hypothetical protein
MAETQAIDWEGRYRDGNTGWERHGLNPAFLAWRDLGILTQCRILIPGTGRCSSCLCKATGLMGRRSIAVSTQCAGCSLRLHGAGASPCLSGSSTRPGWPSSRLCFDGSETAAGEISLARIA